jgi:hypothetical protein
MMTGMVDFQLALFDNPSLFEARHPQTHDYLVPLPLSYANRVFTVLGFDHAHIEFVAVTRE